MNIIDSILLGIIQGLTEFLPISSSGHLVLAQYFLDINNSGILLEIVLHLGTLLSILLYYRSDILELFQGILQRRYASLYYVFMLIVATIPVLLIGLIFRIQVEYLFFPKYIPYMLLISGCILLSTKYVAESQHEITLKIAILIGCAQVFAIAPGISRSGVTISLALLFGIHRANAAKFSFFMAIPVLLAAGILELRNMDVISIQVWPILVGFLSAFISGYIAIKWLINLLSNQHFWKFSYYCIFVGIICIITGVGS